VVKVSSGSVTAGRDSEGRRSPVEMKAPDSTIGFVCIKVRHPPQDFIDLPDIWSEIRDFFLPKF
jgi:hypothetical protein